jgi:hypothetical protein
MINEITGEAKEKIIQRLKRGPTELHISDEDIKDCYSYAQMQLSNWSFWKKVMEWHEDKFYLTDDEFPAYRKRIDDFILDNDNVSGSLQDNKDHELRKRQIIIDVCATLIKEDAFDKYFKENDVTDEVALKLVKKYLCCITMVYYRDEYQDVFLSHVRAYKKSEPGRRTFLSPSSNRDDR